MNSEMVNIRPRFLKLCRAASPDYSSADVGVPPFRRQVRTRPAAAGTPACAEGFRPHRLLAIVQSESPLWYDKKCHPWRPPAPGGILVRLPPKPG